MKTYQLLTGLGAITFAATRLATAQVCPQTSSPSGWSGATLDTGTVRSGTAYVGTVTPPRLELTRQGGLFQSTQLGTPGTVMYAASADFNRDGFPDFIGASENTANDYLALFTNYTWQNENCTTAACTAFSGAPPDWDNPAYVVTPKFTQGVNLHTQYIPTTTAVSYNGRYSLAAGDFDGDGWPDLFQGYAAASGAHDISVLNMYLNAGTNVAGVATFKPRYNAAAAGFTPGSALGRQLWSTVNTATVDYNTDGKLDVLVGHGDSGGSIRILLNACPGAMQGNGVFLCSAPPEFIDGGDLITNLATIGGAAQGFGTNTAGGTPTFAFGDLDQDGYADLVVAAPNCCSTAARRVRLFRGCASGGTCINKLDVGSPQALSSAGGVTGVFMADFSLDGRPDLIVATDDFNYNPGNGGIAFYYVNNGTSTPLTGAPTPLTTRGGLGSTDYDLGFLFDYDNDPTHSIDVMIADGNNALKYFVLANRVSPQFVACGDAISGQFDLGALATSEMAVKSARVTPALTLPAGTSITFWMSNEDPAVWTQASLCSGSTVDYCVSFPRAASRIIRWKAIMCSNGARTLSPTLTSISAKFDYTAAREHYRAGTIVSDGVTYLGAFSQPGDRGRFYAIDAGLSQVYWEAGVKLDATADSARNIFTASGSTPIPFTTTEATNPALRSLLATTDIASTASLISWSRGARFGLGSVAKPLTKLGAIQTSTPAILGAPARPTWYSFVTLLERTRIEAFITAQQARVPLVLFGSKDGMVHAVYTKPTNITEAKNGTEAWAYIPPTVANRLLADFSASQAAQAASTDGLNHAVARAYPDGAPTLVDVSTGGSYKTLALVAEGNGGTSISAFDVTSTVNPVSGIVTGPTPLWSASPGDSAAGPAFSKPAVARVQIGGVERYLAISATGATDADLTRGRIVAAYDALTGQLLWRFQAKCAVLTDVAVFETDDAGEPGLPVLDGFADRAVFADRCGYVYKVDPASDRAGGWLPNPGMGSIVANTTPTGVPQRALFYAKTTGGLGVDRPISGTLAARTDTSTRMILFFGTGGLESEAASIQNAFFAVYADTGAVRSKFLGTCTAGQCEKFYGGTLVTPEQIIFTRTVDPLVATGTCDVGSATVQAMEVNAGAGTDFVQDFSQAVGSAVMGAMYGDAGALYFTTHTGQVKRIGTPRVSKAGGDTAAGQQQGMGAGDPASGGVGTTQALALMSWRVVL